MELPEFQFKYLTPKELYSFLIDTYGKDCFRLRQNTKQILYNEKILDINYFYMELKIKHDVNVIPHELQEVLYYIACINKYNNSISDFIYHPWYEKINNYISNKNICTTKEILTNVLEKKEEEITKSDQMEVSKIIKSLGFNKKNISRKPYHKGRYWIKQQY